MGVTEDDSRPPEWMVILENKRRKPHKLAHEIGAGAPCLSCRDACSGLDLHFWRKLCRSCKCKKEAHDIKEEDSYEQLEILLGIGVIKNREHIKKFSLDLAAKLKSGFLGNKLHGAGTEVEQKGGVIFDWIPTDVPLNLASEYMQQLPLEKIPISGTEGAIFRRQQLQKQIPLYDFDVNKCHELSVEETQAFMNYVENLKHAVIGQGHVTKISSAQSATEHVPDQAEHTPQKYQFSKNSNITPKPFKPFTATVTSDSSDNTFRVPDLLHPATELKTPSAFLNRNLLLPHPKPSGSRSESSGPEMEEHESQITEEPNIKPSMLRGTPFAKHQLVGAAEDEKLSNTPLGSANVEAQEDIRSLDTPCREPSEPRDKVPDPLLKGADGRVCRINTPATFEPVSEDIQSNPLLPDIIPPSRSQREKQVCFGPTTIIDVDELGDQVAAVSPFGSVDDIEMADLFCHHCSGALNPGEVAIRAERAGLGYVWHPQCFVCHNCKELLVDLVYFFHKGDVYCGRHYAEVINIPRCFACDELIFLKEYTIAEGQTFHVKHFCCFECDTPLAGMQYVPKDGNPICLGCYNAKYGKYCQFCKKLIEAAESRLGWKDLSWHAIPECFKCFECSKCLLGEKFVVKNDQHPLCSQECIRRYKIRHDRKN